MSLNELFSVVNQLSHQDKLRLIHFLLLAVAKEDGCSLEPTAETNPENVLISQLASAEALVWSPQTTQTAVRALSELLMAAREANNA